MADTTFRPGNTHSVAYTGTHGATSKVSKNTTKIRVWASTDAFIAIGASPTATSASMPVTGKVAEYFDVTPSDKVSFIQQSSAGTGYITEMSK